MVVKGTQSRHLYYLKEFAFALSTGTRELQCLRNELRSPHKLNLTQCQLTVGFYMLRLFSCI